MQYIEVTAHPEQRVGGVVISVEHQQSGVAADGIADADVVAVAATHRVVGAAHGGEYQVVAAAGLFGKRREVALRDDAGHVKRIRLVVGSGCFEEWFKGFRT